MTTQDDLERELAEAKAALRLLRDDRDRRLAEADAISHELNGASAPPTPTSVLGQLASLRLELLRAGGELPAPSREERILARRAEVLGSALVGIGYEAAAAAGPLERAEQTVQRVQQQLQRDFPAPPVNMLADELARLARGRGA